MTLEQILPWVLLLSIVAFAAWWIFRPSARSRKTDFRVITASAVMLVMTGGFIFWQSGFRVGFDDNHRLSKESISERYVFAGLITSNSNVNQNALVHMRPSTASNLEIFDIDAKFDQLPPGADFSFFALPSEHVQIDISPKPDDFGKQAFSFNLTGLSEPLLTNRSSASAGEPVCEGEDGGPLDCCFGCAYIDENSNCVPVPENHSGPVALFCCERAVTTTLPNGEVAIALPEHVGELSPSGNCQGGGIGGTMGGGGGDCPPDDPLVFIPPGSAVFALHSIDSQGVESLAYFFGDIQAWVDNPDEPRGFCVPTSGDSWPTILRGAVSSLGCDSASQAYIPALNLFTLMTGIFAEQGSQNQQMVFGVSGLGFIGNIPLAIPSGLMVAGRSSKPFPVLGGHGGIQGAPGLLSPSRGGSYGGGGAYGGGFGGWGPMGGPGGGGLYVPQRLMPMLLPRPVPIVVPAAASPGVSAAMTCVKFIVPAVIVAAIGAGVQYLITRVPPTAANCLEQIDSCYKKRNLREPLITPWKDLPPNENGEKPITIDQLAFCDCLKEICTSPNKPCAVEETGDPDFDVRVCDMLVNENRCDPQKFPTNPLEPIRPLVTPRPPELQLFPQRERPITGDYLGPPGLTPGSGFE